jgi:hypothetical protein
MANRNSLTAGIRAAALLLAFSWLAAGQSPSPAGRLETLKTKGLDAEVMVLPVRLFDGTMSEAGEVVGELVAVSLEHGGMRKVDWTTQAFSRSGEATFQQMSTAFGDYVRQSAITTEYTLYAEFLGTPGAGVAEIRGLLVDKGGNPVWSYRQTPEDEEFKKAQPRDLLKCIAMLVNALREPLGLQDPFGPNAFEGRLTERRAKRTGSPTSGEQAALQKALETARTKFVGSKVVVFATLIGGKPDGKQANHLAEMLTDQKLGKAEVATAQPAIEIQNVPNEAQRLWQMARAIREYLHQTPAAADYAVLADYAFAPDGKAFTVHFVVCDHNGEWVIVDLQNNHHADFQAMELRSGDDCDRLVTKRLDRFLRAGADGGQK